MCIYLCMFKCGAVERVVSSVVYATVCCQEYNAREVLIGHSLKHFLFKFSIVCNL